MTLISFQQCTLVQRWSTNKIEKNSVKGFKNKKVISQFYTLVVKASKVENTFSPLHIPVLVKLKNIFQPFCEMLKNKF